MKIILLSGGSGKRLWPLSNDARSKQFLKVLQNEEGGSESMIQRIFRQLGKSCPDTEIILATSEVQSDSIRRQLGNETEKVLEPSRRNTYPAILLSGAYLLDCKQVPDDEIIIVLPVDTYVEQDYFDKFRDMERALTEFGAEICLMGIHPTYPSEKYGYIIVSVPDGESCGRVVSCVEKPDLAQARRLMQDGALWNGGIFMFRASFVKALIAKELGTVSYEAVYRRYHELPYISFDYEVIERHPSMACVIYDGEWNDLGTWNTLTEQMKEPDGGFVIRDDGCNNTHVINELEIPIVAMGLQDTVVVASADGILVSDKHASSFLLPCVEQIDNRPMYEKRQWGEYKVLDVQQCKVDAGNSLTKSMYIEAGTSVSYQLHHFRDEVWPIVDGRGIFLLDGEARRVGRGDVLFIPRECKHAIWSLTGLSFIEVQIGSDLVEEDIERLDWDWSEILRQQGETDNDGAK